MSYDLVFCRQEGPGLDFDQLARWATRYECFRKPEATQLWYENEETGVYFSLDCTGPESVVSEESQVPPGYTDLGLSFNLNFLRPSFFAHEAMRIVEDFARTFKLLAIDLQEDDTSPKVCNADELIKSWSDSNRRAVAAYFDNYPDEKQTLPYMPLHQSLKFWGYMITRKALEQELEEEDIFVPKLGLVQRSGSDRVQTVVTWVPGIRMIVPNSDWAVIVRERRGRFRSSKKEIGFLSTSTLLKLVGDCLEPYDPGLDLHILRTENAQKVQPLLSSVELRLRSDDFARVKPDGFQDALAPEGDWNA